MNMIKIVLVLALEIFNACVLASNIATFTVWQGSKDCSGTGTNEFMADVTQSVTNGCIDAQALTSTSKYNAGDAISIKYVCAGAGVTKEEKYLGGGCAGTPYASTSMNDDGFSAFVAAAYGGQCGFLQSSNGVATARLSKPLANLNNIPACATAFYTTYQGKTDCSGTGVASYKFDITQSITNNFINGQALASTSEYNAGDAISFKYECWISNNAEGEGLTTAKTYRCAGCACTPFSSATFSGKGFKLFIDASHGGQCGFIQGSSAMSARSNLSLVNKSQLVPDCSATTVESSSSSSPWDMPSMIGYLVVLFALYVFYMRKIFAGAFQIRGRMTSDEAIAAYLAL